MKSKSVLFVSGCLDTKSSGPYLSMQQTVQTLLKRGYSVEVAGTRRTKKQALKHEWPIELKTFQRYGPDSMHYAPSFKQWLEAQGAKYDVVSMQGVWLHMNHLAAQWCVRHSRPYLITTHGNFNPQAIRISAWKKWLARKTFMSEAFENVACYQALTENEYQSLRDYGIKKPICVIGNGIDIPNLQTLDSLFSLIPKFASRHRICLYLGRLHPIKGVERLLQAWAHEARGDEWQLVIAGSGNDNYQKKLELLAIDAGCKNVHFVGFVSGKVKAAWLQAADFLVLPSFSEAQAMTPMEAFSYATPALLTEACGFPEAARAGAALEVSSSTECINEGLRIMLNKSSGELEDMGLKARAFVSAEYGWDRICRQLESVYSWMCGSEAVPDCLRFD